MSSVIVPPRALRRLSAAVVIALASLGLAACGGGDATASATVAASSPSASATPSLSTEDAALRSKALAMKEPTKPAEMKEKSVDGAVAAAEYFLDLYPYVYATGDLTEWKAMSSPSCRFCNSVIKNVKTLHEAGGWADAGEQTITEQRYGDFSDDELTIQVDSDVTTVGASLHNPEKPVSGETAGASPASARETVSLILRWSNGKWIVDKGQAHSA